MSVKQISVSLENVPGKLSEVSDCLEKNRINILALCVADTANISTARFVADDPEKAVNVLKTHGYPVRVTEVLAVGTPNHPGGLHAVLKPLKEQNITVLYLYACLATAEKTILIIGVDKMEEAVQVLRKNWVQMLDEDLYALE
jgi:hypothetical protein